MVGLGEGNLRKEEEGQGGPKEVEGSPRKSKEVQGRKSKDTGTQKEVFGSPRRRFLAAVRMWKDGGFAELQAPTGAGRGDLEKRACGNAE